MPILRWIIILSLFISNAGYSDQVDQIHQTLQENLKLLNANATVTDIQASAIPGILEVLINDQEYVYFSQKGDHLIAGRLFAFDGTSALDLTEQRMEKNRAATLAKLSLEEAISFSPGEDIIGEVFVFTDVSCAYCVNFHKKISDITNLGITVHYFAFPRTGPASEAGRLMRDVWCSEDRHLALTEAKLEGRLNQRQLPCTSPIAQHIKSARSLGVTGTPAIYTSDGKWLGGFVTPEQLKAAF